MNSRVFQGETTHCRHRPTRHAFRYPMFWLAIDLDELESLDKNVAWFGYNRRAIASIRDADYGGAKNGSIRERIYEHLRAAGFERATASITLLTIPRILGYVFNPVSFYLCFDADRQLTALVAEVRNTFGEMHHYISAPRPTNDADTLRFILPKEFYVSPFLDVNGAYDIRLTREGDDRLDMNIHLRSGGETVFSAGMRGTGVPLSSRTLIATLLRFPLFAATIMLRIKWQAFLLYCRRRLPMFTKPDPAHPATTPAIRPGVWHRLRAFFVRHARRSPSHDTSQAFIPERDSS